MSYFEQFKVHFLKLFCFHPIDRYIYKIVLSSLLHHHSHKHSSQSDEDESLSLQNLQFLINAENGKDDDGENKIAESHEGGSFGANEEIHWFGCTVRIQQRRSMYMQRIKIHGINKTLGSVHYKSRSLQLQLHLADSLQGNN
ncbi:uncharacterized protein [Solanum lycopersicum]|uniref:uncharacterized protein n=1 Tax=Solanum lycopersicum TaxID=4081 RepID=UPI0037491E45